MRTPHTATQRGKRVKVKLRDGTIILDRFIDRTKNAIILKDYGKLLKKNIKSFSIYKLLAHEKQ